MLLHVVDSAANLAATDLNWIGHWSRGGQVHGKILGVGSFHGRDNAVQAACHAIVRPPETLIVWPVMYAASSDNRNAMIPG